MKIKIIGCTNPNWWYKDLIGQEFDFVKMDGENYVVVRDDQGNWGSILPQDGEAVEN